jgi:hypothetical protein
VALAAREFAVLEYLARRTGDAVEGADLKSMPVSQNGLNSEPLEELAALASERSAMADRG